MPRRTRSTKSIGDQTPADRSNSQAAPTPTANVTVTITPEFGAGLPLSCGLAPFRSEKAVGWEGSLVNAPFQIQGETLIATAQMRLVTAQPFEE